MRLHKCLYQTVDLDHVLAVSDLDPVLLRFDITLAMRDEPLQIGATALAFQFSEGKYIGHTLADARETLIRAWSGT